MTTTSRRCSPTMTTRTTTSGRAARKPGAMIGNRGDAATIGNRGNAATIGKHGNAATIGKHSNAATIGKHGNAAINVERCAAKTSGICGNATTIRSRRSRGSGTAIATRSPARKKSANLSVRAPARGAR